MKIIDILNRKEVTLSFEVFPPKTDEGLAAVTEAASGIAALGPDFMSVTYGAGGGNGKNTAKVAASLQDRYGLPVLAHLTCVSSGRDQVRAMIGTYEKIGVGNIMALRGDIPKGGRTAFDYMYASELVREIKSLNPEICVGGACYPEGHVESGSRKEDILHVKEKVDAGCDFLTTQMFFDNDAMYNFLYRAREAGIEVPILAGIMPITSERQISRSAALSGASVPARLRAMADRFGHDPAQMQQAGIIFAADQILDLIANGVTHIHVYSMNKPEVAAGILRALTGIVECGRG